MPKRCHLALATVPLLVGATVPAPASALAGAGGEGLPSPARLVTENVKSHPAMPQRHVLHDVHVGTRLGAVVLWQEIGPARYKAALRRLPHDWRTVQAATEDPISFNTHVWRLVSAQRAALSRGRAHVTHQRWVTWAVLRNRRTGRALAFMNTHYVSSAWDSRRVSHKAWRKRLWTKEWRKQDAVVDRLTQRGLTILGGGDFNRDRLRHFSPRQSDLNHGGIDHLWVIPGASGDVQPNGTRRYKHLYSDHDAVVASFTVR